MSDHVANSYRICDGKAAQSSHPYHSAWMAHWMGAGCGGSTHMHNHLSLTPGNIDIDHDSYKRHLSTGSESKSDVSRSAKGNREAGTSEIIDESLAVSSKKLRHERVGSQSFPIFKLCQESGKRPVPKNERDAGALQALRPQADHKKFPASLNIVPVAPPETGTSSRECHFQPEGILPVPADQVKYHMFFGESSYSCSRPSKGKFTGSASHIRLDHGEHKFDSGTTAVPSFMRRRETANLLTPVFESEERISKTNLTILEQEQSKSHSHSAVLVCEEETNSFPKCEKSVAPYLRQSNTALLKSDPSTSIKNSPMLGEEQYQRMQNHFGFGFFQNQGGPPEMIRSGKLHYGQCLLPTVPHFFHDAETTRMHTSLGSVEGLAGGLARFSQTSSSLLISKHPDANFCEENQILRESRVSTHLKENMFGELHRTSPLSAHGRRGVKLQLLGSSTDTKEKENVEDVKTFAFIEKNESSAETDTMDMESCKKNNVSVIKSSTSNKDIMLDPNLAVQATTTLAAGDWHGKRIIELPDINLELPAIPSSSSSMEKPEPCTSRTETLEMDSLLFQIDQPSNSKSNGCADGLLGTDPSSRWIKRLKLSASAFPAFGTKSSKLSEVSSHEKVSKFFKIMKGSISSSESTMSKSMGKELIVLDQTTAITRKGQSSFVETRKVGHDITLSHSWIQRWCHNQVRKKAETMVTCEPQSSKLALEDFQKKQFPSIAALALMGKAMTGFQQCEFQKRDSFVVWNTKNF